MSEIEIGDKVALYANFYGVLRRAVCIVRKVSSYGVLVKFLEVDKHGYVILFDQKTGKTQLSFPQDNFDNFWFSKKQCRKLVKVTKCDGCDGEGEIVNKFKRNYAGRDVTLAEIIECQKCNGKGKIKI